MQRTSTSHGRRQARWAMPVLLTAAALVGGQLYQHRQPGPFGRRRGTPAGAVLPGDEDHLLPRRHAWRRFETVVYNGAKAAEAAFGPTVTYQWSDWDPNKMVTQFQEAVATKPTASPSWATPVTTHSTR